MDTQKNIVEFCDEKIFILLNYHIKYVILILISKQTCDFKGGIQMRELATLDARIIAEAQYFIRHKSTVRKTAEYFNISKSTVFTHLTYRLQQLDPSLSKNVRDILDFNKAERHMRGGMATKRKFSGVSK